MKILYIELFNSYPTHHARDRALAARGSSVPKDKTVNDTPYTIDVDNLSELINRMCWEIEESRGHIGFPCDKVFVWVRTFSIKDCLTESPHVIIPNFGFTAWDTIV